MRGRVEPVPVMRERLLRRFEDAAVVLIEASGGYGKTFLAAQVAAARDVPTARVVVDDGGDLWSTVQHALIRSGLADVADTVHPEAPAALAGAVSARPGGVVLTIDEVQRCSPVEARWLRDLALAVAPPALLMIIGRRIGKGFARLAADGTAVLIDTEDLRFDAGETAQALGGIALSDRDVYAVHAVTGGWPAAVALAGARLASGGHLPDAAGVGSLAELVERQLAGCTPDQRQLVRELAHLPLLSAEVAERVGGSGSLDLLLDTGLPIRFRTDGWGELADPVREHLTRDRSPELTTIRAAAAVYERRGEAPAACLLLSHHDDRAGLVDLLARRSWSHLGAIGLPTLDVLLESIPDDLLAPHAMVLVRAALAADERDVGRRSRWLDRARRLSRDPAITRAATVEIGRDLGRQHEMEQATMLLEQALAACEPTELVTRGRALLALGTAHLVIEQGRASQRSIDELEHAAALFRAAEERGFESNALRASAFGAHFNLGAFDTASEQMTRAASLLSAPDAARALFLTFVAEIDRDLGRLDAAETALQEALAIARRVASPQVVGYTAWGLALVAGERRDRAGVDRWCREAVANGDGWLDRGAGVDYYAMVAEVLLQLGDIDGGREHVEAAEQHPAAHGYVWPARSARARYEAVFGDPVRAEQVLDELDTIAPPREVPLRLLLRAVCAARVGDTEEASRLAERAGLMATELGDPERLQRREPELLGLVRTDTAAAAATAEWPSGASIRLLGEFTVWRKAERVTPPAGRAATLVKVLALRGSITTDAAIDLLWDGCDAETGRSRLRNLLHRVRAVSGGLVERDGELLRLAASTEVDAVRFEQAASRAIESDASARVGAARAALAIWTGDLLPGDLYEEWAAVVRERLRRQHLAVVDLVAHDAVERGDLDEAARLLEVGIESEPFELWRFELLAQSLVTQGRSRSAADVARRAARQADELGVEVGAALARLLR